MTTNAGNLGCPRCGYANDPPFERESGRMECEGCGRVFCFEADVTVEWVTWIEDYPPTRHAA